MTPARLPVSAGGHSVPKREGRAGGSEEAVQHLARLQPRIAQRQRVVRHPGLQVSYVQSRLLHQLFMAHACPHGCQIPSDIF